MGLKLKAAMCDLFLPSVTFLENVIDMEGINTDPAKIAALTELKMPNCVEVVQSFLGLAG